MAIAPFSIDFSSDFGIPAALPAYAQTITGLVGGSTYDFQVLAFNAAGNGLPSSPFIVATTKAAVTSNFSVAAGRLMTPAGAVFVGKGVSIPDDQLSTWVTNAACQPLTTLFAGITIVRVPSYSYWSPSTFSTYINRLTSIGIVVVLENHQNFNADGSSAGNAGGSQGVVLTGALLTNESNWYASLASFFITNPLVWFGTNNEPSTNPSAAALSTWQQATYTAIRNTGNKSIIEIEQPNPNQQGAGGGLTASVYRTMSNIVMGPHYYSWVWNGQTNNTSQATILNSAIGSTNSQWGGIVQQVATIQALTSADGIVPCGCFEFGPSTNGQSLDIAGMNCVNAVLQALSQGTLFGYMAWWINADGSPDALTTSTTTVTSPYGSAIKANI